MTGDAEMGTTTTTTTRRPRRRPNEETKRRPESYYASSYNDSPTVTSVRGMTHDERAMTWGLRGFVPPKKFRVRAYAYAHCEESGDARVDARTNGMWMSRRSVDGTREMTSGEEGDGEDDEAARERGAGAARREAETRRRQVGGMTSRPSWGAGMMTKAAAC